MFYAKWKHRAVSDSDVVVLPDGCKDILIVEDACSESNIKLTDWDDRARTVSLKKGYYSGPGKQLSASARIERVGFKRIA